jgi:ribose 5-phosphate isomerase B
VASSVSEGKFDRGILICGSGQGMGISANKVKGVRAAVCYDVLSAVLSRNHNDANVLCTGAWMIEPALAERMVVAWLSVGFNGGRHADRVNKIVSIEEGVYLKGNQN